MEPWAVLLSKELQKRNNKNTLGPILGIVLSPPPYIRISILEGQVVLSEIYMLESILEEYIRKVTMPLEWRTGEITIEAYKTIREDAELAGEKKDYKIHAFEIREKEIVTKNTLKKGDKVLLLSSPDNQTYFCLGKVKKVGR